MIVTTAQLSLRNVDHVRLTRCVALEIYVHLAAQDRRTQSRNATHLWANLWREGDAVSEKVIVLDLSSDGFKVRSAGTFVTGDILVLELLSGLNAEVSIVHSDPDLGEHGCRFFHRLPPAIVHRVLHRAGARSQARVDETVREVRVRRSQASA